MILETAYVIVQLENSVSLLWLDQTIQLQLFLILATIALNPLNCTFYEIFQCHQQNMETSYYIYDAFIFFYQNYLRKLTKDAMVIVTKNVAQVLVVFHI